MVFKLTEFIDYYKIKANCYSIEIYKTPISMKEYLCIVEKLKYYCTKNQDSFLSIYSTTESKSAKHKKINIQKRGRPRKIIEGKKIDGHIHTIVIGNENHSAFTSAKSIKKSIDKTFKKPSCKIVSKSDNLHVYNMIGYCFKQADVIRTGGDFDFETYYKTHDLFS